MAAPQHQETLGGNEGESDALPDINRFLDDVGCGDYKDHFKQMTTEFLLTFKENELELGDVSVFME